MQPHLPPGIVWIASFPKSGNTWVRILLSNIFAGTERPEDINRLSLPGLFASGRALFEDLTLSNSFLFTPEEIDRLRPMVHDAYAAQVSGPALMKTHDAYTRLEDGTPILGAAARAALYVVRDPRDVAVSYAFHQSVGLDEAIGDLNDPNAYLGGADLQFRQRLNGWSGHAESWTDQHDIPVHVVRYEDLQEDTSGTLRGMLDFLGASYDPEAVATAVRFSDFAELQKQEREKGFRERPNGMPAFFRSGATGAWRRHLSLDQLHAIENVHAKTMRRFGYVPETVGGTHAPA